MRPPSRCHSDGSAAILEPADATELSQFVAMQRRPRVRVDSRLKLQRVVFDPTTATGSAAVDIRTAVFSSPAHCSSRVLFTPGPREPKPAIGAGRQASDRGISPRWPSRQPSGFPRLHDLRSVEHLAVRLELWRLSHRNAASHSVPRAEPSRRGQWQTAPGFADPPRSGRVLWRHAPSVRTWVPRSSFPPMLAPRSAFHAMIVS
jgi:hypothetical protein